MARVRPLLLSSTMLFKILLLFFYMSSFKSNNNLKQNSKMLICLTETVDTNRIRKFKSSVNSL